MTGEKVSSGPRRRALVLRLVVYSGLLLLGWWMLPKLVRMMVYPAPRFAIPNTPPEPLRAVSLTRKDGGRLVAWHQAASVNAPSVPLVIYFHGNAENLATMWGSGIFQDWQKLGVSLLAVEYPGYGPEGVATEAGLVEAGSLAVAWAREHEPAAPLVIAGWSLGAGVAAQTAARENQHIQAVVLLSAWSSLPDVAAAHYPRWLVRLLIKERYDSVAAAADISVPALVMHGARDGIIPATQGKRVAEALPDGAWIPVERYEHNDLLMAYPVWREIESFLQRNLP